MWAQPSSQTILVVDDDIDTVEFYQDLLASAGYQVLRAASGQQARTLASRQPIAGILLGNRLSDTTGGTLCREFRMTFGPSMPLLLVTADREAGLEARAFAAGATVFLHKPFEPEVLLTLLEAYVRFASVSPERSEGTAAGK
jgi:pilus assembly protein CpaE